MNDVARVSVTPAGVSLGPLTQIADRTARNFVVQTMDGRFHGFVVRLGDDVCGYVDRCPHAGLPLAKVLDDYMAGAGRYIACSWHGALFDPDTGDCVGGPCAGQRLSRWPVHIIDGIITTA